MRDVEVQRFADSASRVQQDENEQVQTTLAVCRALKAMSVLIWSPVNVGRISLWLLKLRNSRRLTRPLQVGIDGTNAAITARGFQPLLTHTHDERFQVGISRRLSSEPCKALAIPLDGCRGDVREVLTFFDEQLESSFHGSSKAGDQVGVGGDPLDDVMDSARYELYSWVTASEKPRETILEETLRPLAEIGDLTSAMVRYQQITAEAPSRPVRLGRYHSSHRWRG